MERRTGKIRGAFSTMHRALDGWMLARAPASPDQGLHHHGPRYFIFPYFCTMWGLEKLGIVDQNWLERICPIWDINEPIEPQTYCIAVVVYAVANLIRGQLDREGQRSIYTPTKAPNERKSNAKTTRTKEKQTARYVYSILQSCTGTCQLFQ